MDKQEFLTKYASHLNENQRKAVLSVEGPTLLLAVPGSGKTTVLVNRLGYMVFCEGINPESILTLTYTVAATNDMAKRFSTVFGEEYSNLLEFRTINGICAKIISKYGQMIGKTAFELVTDEKILGKVITDILVKNMSEYPTESDVKGAKTLITYCKNMLLSDDEIDALGEEEDIPLLEIFKEYNNYLKSNRLMDYDDQMIYAYNMLRLSPELLAYYKNIYKYICVDEAQDTSKVQHIIIKLLAGENGNLFMVGDEDQSIYGFRAAYPEALLNFEKDYPSAKVLVMDQNYRSNAKIVAAADGFIQRNKDRHNKHMVATKAADSDVHYIDLRGRSCQYSYLVKVAKDCSKETAILYRDNESALPLVDLLDRHDIPYKIKSVDMAFFTHRVVTDVTNILRFALNPYDTELFMRIYFKCQTYLKKNQAEQLCRISAAKGISVLEAAEYTDVNGMVLGKCKAFASHLKGMVSEPPSKALFRIETQLGYAEYLERNNISDNKLFILKMLAGNEKTVVSFLERLNYLQDMLKSQSTRCNSKFILSTIHSSKGLEYDQVYLMDVCNGVFPDKITNPKSTPQEKKVFEEERRLFYVGMTRAKSELNIFKYADAASIFIKELCGKTIVASEKPSFSSAATSARPYSSSSKVLSDYVLSVGERVIQAKYGAGTVRDIEYDFSNKVKGFTVAFDSGEEKSFAFPMAFKAGMSLENGSNIELKDATTNAKSLKNKPSKGYGASAKTIEPKKSYSYWATRYPDCVVVKKEGSFWTCRGESAKTLSYLLGYNLGGKPDNPVTGSPNLSPIVRGLRENDISYIVVEDDEIIDEGN